MFRIDLMEVKIICIDKTSLADTKICTQVWSFLTYGDKAVSPPKFKVIKNWVKN